MRERLLTLILGLTAGLAFLAWLVQGQGGHAVPRPTTESPGGSGYRAARLWLTGAQIPVRSWREPFVGLAQAPGLPPTGNLLIVTVPAAEPFAGPERAALNRWVAAGNTLVVLAALADAPDWAFAGAGAAADLSLVTGLSFEAAPIAVRTTDASRWRRRTLVPTRPDALLVGVPHAVAISEHPPPGAGQLRLPREGFVLALAKDPVGGEEVLWTTTAGRGRVLVSAYSSLFSDRALAQGGNARLFANLVGGSLAGQGAVLFDDFHQGLADLYDPARFYQDPRLHRSFLVLLAVWLAWVLGGAPLRARPSVPTPPGEAELVRATGLMLARVLPARAAAQGLFVRFFERVRHRTSRQGGGAPWGLLERNPRIAAHDLAQLKAWHDTACGAGRLPLNRPAWLARLHNLMQRIERQMDT